MISSIVVFNWSNYHNLLDEHVKGRLKIQVRPQNMQRNYIYLFINSYFFRTRLHE